MALSVSGVKSLSALRIVPSDMLAAVVRRWVVVCRESVKVDERRCCDGGLEDEVQSGGRSGGDMGKSSRARELLEVDVDVR